METKGTVVRTTEEIAQVREVYQILYDEHKGDGCPIEVQAGQAIMMLDWLEGKPFPCGRITFYGTRSAMACTHLEERRLLRYSQNC